MKNICKKNKLILALALTFSLLNANSNALSKKIIDLLKKTDSSLAIWNDLQHKWIWTGATNQAKIASACHTLKETQKALAISLAQLNSNKQEFTYEDRKAALAVNATRIERSTPPSYLRRNWVRYSASTIGLIGGAYLLSNYGYDDDGNHLIENFYRNHIIDPTTNMYGILTKKNTDQAVLEQDTDDALKRFTSKLNLFIENAKQEPELNQIVINHIPQNIPIEKVPLKQKLAFLDATLTFMHTHMPTEIVESFKTIKVWNWLNMPHLHHALNSHILLLQQLRVEKMLATKKIEEVSQKVNLTIELIAAIPALVASYVCFKSLHTYINKYKYNSTYKPLKKLLIKLQLQYNQERYLATPSLETQGMHIYWMAQLKDASQGIPAADKVTYCDYLERLENDELLPKQKITIIENMLRDVLFLQKV